MSILITSVLNCASDRLAVSSLLSRIFSGALICSFIWAIFFFFVWRACYISKEQSLRCLGGQGNPCCCIVMLYMGEGSEREQCHSLHSRLAFSHFHRYPQANWAFLVMISQWVVCVLSRTLWVSPTNSSLRLGVSPAAVSTPIGFYSQRFWDFISLCWNPGLGSLSHSPVVPPSLSTCKCGTTWSTSDHLASPSPPAASLPLLFYTLAACLLPFYRSG